MSPTLSENSDAPADTANVLAATLPDAVMLLAPRDPATVMLPTFASLATFRLVAARVPVVRLAVARLPVVRLPVAASPVTFRLAALALPVASKVAVVDLPTTLKLPALALPVASKDVTSAELAPSAPVTVIAPEVKLVTLALSADRAFVILAEDIVAGPAVMLATLVLPATFRSPVMLADPAVTADTVVLSDTSVPAVKAGIDALWKEPDRPVTAPLAVRVTVVKGPETSIFSAKMVSVVISPSVSTKRGA